MEKLIKIINDLICAKFWGVLERRMLQEIGMWSPAGAKPAAEPSQPAEDPEDDKEEPE